MKLSPVFSRGFFCVATGFGSLVVALPSSSSAATSALSPPQYPEACDTTTLPQDFEFPAISSKLPYDLGSLKTVKVPDPTPPTPSDCDVFETQKQFDLFSWGTFIGLNWPADDSGNPLPGTIGSQPTAPRVWEYYLTPAQIFKKNGSAPDAWGTPEFAHRTLSSISKHTEVLDEVDEAFFNLETPLPPITDLNNAYVRYEVRINQSEYDYIVTNTLYNLQGQQAFIAGGNTVSFPSGQVASASASASGVAVRGAMELKVAWKEMGPGDDLSKFYTIKPEVKEPFAPGKPTVKGKTYGLVGMHIMVRTHSAPEWVWATFEHVDNAPIVDLRQGVPTAVTATGHFNFWNTNGSHSFGGFDPTVYETIEANKKGDNYYQPLADRNPTQITRVVTDNNAVSVSDWTNHLNQTMQASLAGTVWANYRLISTQRPVDPGTAPAGNPAPVSLSNPVMETYMQVNGSCMGCHAGATYGGSAKTDANANFSFMLQRAHSKSLIPQK